MGCDIHLYVEKKGYTDTWEFMIHKDAAYGSRNYELFSILAGVRNRFNIIPIVEPRGLPTDMSPLLKEIASEYLEHTPSWLLLSEIDAYLWDTDKTMSGLVSPEDMEQWKKSGSLRPRSWCQGTTEKDYTLCMIPYNTKEWCSEFLEWIESLKKASFYFRNSPEKVRFVFWFDN